LVVWNETEVIPREVEVYLPGSGQRVHNIATGESAPAGETERYTLKTADGVNQSIQFFTWEKNGASGEPRISS
jgi:hypothetical protein